jgi:hypothetical protein
MHILLSSSPNWWACVVTCAQITLPHGALVRVAAHDWPPSRATHRYHITSALPQVLLTCACRHRRWQHGGVCWPPERHAAVLPPAPDRALPVAAASQVRYVRPWSTHNEGCYAHAQPAFVDAVPCFAQRTPPSATTAHRRQPGTRCSNVSHVLPRWLACWPAGAHVQGFVRCVCSRRHAAGGRVRRRLSALLQLGDGRVRERAAPSQVQAQAKQHGAHRCRGTRLVSWRCVCVWGGGGRGTAAAAAHAHVHG